MTQGPRKLHEIWAWVKYANQDQLTWMRYVLDIAKQIQASGANLAAIKDDGLESSVHHMASSIVDATIVTKQSLWASKKERLLIELQTMEKKRKEQKKPLGRNMKPFIKDVDDMLELVGPRHGLLLAELFPLVNLGGGKGYYHDRVKILPYVFSVDFEPEEKADHELGEPPDHTYGNKDQSVVNNAECEARQEQDGTAIDIRDSPGTIELVSSTPHQSCYQHAPDATRTTPNTNGATKRCWEEIEGRRSSDTADSDSIHKRSRPGFEPVTSAKIHEITTSSVEHDGGHQQSPSEEPAHANDLINVYPEEETTPSSARQFTQEKLQQGKRSTPLPSDSSDYLGSLPVLASDTRTIRISLSTMEAVDLLTKKCHREHRKDYPPYDSKESFDYYDLISDVSDMISVSNPTLVQWCNAIKKDNRVPSPVAGYIALHRGDMSKPSYLYIELQCATIS
jgi:hypothetical protein